MTEVDLVALLEASAARRIGHTCFVFRRGERLERVSYGEVARAVGELRAGLATLGIGPGDRVALPASLEHRLEWAVAAFAIWGRGAAIDPDAGVVIADLDAYRELVLRGRRAPLTESHVTPELTALVYDRQRLTHADLLARAVALRPVLPIADSDIALSLAPWSAPDGLALGLLLPLMAGAIIWPRADPRGLASDARELQPTMLVATSDALGTLADDLLRRIARQPPASAALLRLKLARAAVRRALAARGDKQLLRSLERRLLERLSPNDVHALLGRELGLVVAIGRPPTPEVRELFALHGIAVRTVPA